MTWTTVRTEIKRRIDIYDSRIEGCDGDEWIAFNAIIAELHELLAWATRQRKPNDEGGAG